MIFLSSFPRGAGRKIPPQTEYLRDQHIRETQLHGHCKYLTLQSPSKCFSSLKEDFTFLLSSHTQRQLLRNQTILLLKNFFAILRLEDSVINVYRLTVANVHYFPCKVLGNIIFICEVFLKYIIKYRKFKFLYTTECKSLQDALLSKVTSQNLSQLCKNTWWDFFFF